MTLPFKSVDEILKCDHSRQSYGLVFSHVTVYFSMCCKMFLFSFSIWSTFRCGMDKMEGSICFCGVCFAACSTFQTILFQVRTSRIGYYTLNEELKIASTTEKHTMIQQDMVISPRLSLRGNDDMYRIVLTWGRQPKDLDSYLITPWPRKPNCESGMVSV